MSKRIGILGGTFDPIHMGHMIIAEQAYDQFALDEVLLIPSGHSYFKDSREQKVLDPEIRYEMTALAASVHERFTASRIEVDRSGNSYTYETLEALAKEYPGAELYNIVGADTICNMRLWYKPEAIFRNCIILAAGGEEQVSEASMQEEISLLERDYGAVIRTLSVPTIGISSTDIRERVRSGRSIRYLVPEPVERYIMETGIYGDSKKEGV